MDSLISPVTEYVGRNFFQILLCITIGYLFIRSKQIGFLFCALFIGVLALFLNYVRFDHYSVLSDLEQFSLILLGTITGGWRFLVDRGGFSFRYPSIPSLPSFRFLERYENYRDKRIFRKTYAEEFAREQAKKQTWGDKSSGSRPQQDSQKQERKPRRNSYRSEKPQKKQQYRKEKTTNSGSSDRTQGRKENFRKARQESTDQAEQQQSSQYSPGAMSRQEALQVLGLSDGFSKDDLEKNYKRLRSIYHTDKSGNTHADMFLKVQEAHKKLKN